MNKFYYVLIVFVILFFGYGILTKDSNNPMKKEARVPCQKKTVTFEKISNRDLIEKAVSLLESGNYTVKSRIEQSVYMKSQILNYISVEKADKILTYTIKKYLKNDNNDNDKLLIDYYILENDKEDKGKKGTACKLYAGYLVFEFRLNGKLIYKIQTDFIEEDTSDIPERMDCVIKSFITLKG
jgi:hypothetical protein